MSLLRWTEDILRTGSSLSRGRLPSCRSRRRTGGCSARARSRGGHQPRPQHRQYHPLVWPPRLAAGRCRPGTRVVAAEAAGLARQEARPRQRFLCLRVCPQIAGHQSRGRGAGWPGRGAGWGRGRGRGSIVNIPRAAADSEARAPPSRHLQCFKL